MIKVFKFLVHPYFLLALILVATFTVRLYKIDNPVADWHSWRQADTAAVSRNFFKEGFNPFIPKYDDMSGVAQLPIPNPNRYRFVEFPIYNSIVYFGYLFNNGVDERIARLVNILFTLGSVIFVYLISRKYFGEFTAVVASLIFAVLPFNIYFTRVILPEPSLVFFSLGMFFFVDKWIFNSSKTNYLWAFLFTMFAFLTKPYAGFYLLPLIYSYYQKEKRLFPIPLKYFLLFIPAILPFLGWRVWISQHPEGIPASNWLFNGNEIRFKPAFFRWIIQDRFGREILTSAGLILFSVGLFIKPSIKSGWLMHLLALSAFLYLTVLATGNVQHDYYQTLIVPVLAIFTARGFTLLMAGIPNFIPRLFTIPVALLLLPCMFYFGWIEVKGLYQINNPAIVEAGKKADELLPKDAVVVAPYMGDTSFLYQTNRVGWAVVGFPVKDLIDMFKVHYFISTAKDAKTAWVMRKYTVMVETPNYIIIDLTKENPDFNRLTDIEP